MDRTDPSDQSGERRRSAALIAVSAAAVLLAVVAVVVVLVADGAEPSSSVARDGWSGTAVLCRSAEAPELLEGLGRGEVMSLDEDAADLLAAARCLRFDGDLGADADARPVELEADRASFLMGTSADRFDVRLVGVDVGAEPVALRAELDVPADGCGVTADFRGVLTLIVEGPTDALVPEVDVVDVPREC